MDSSQMKDRIQDLLEANNRYLLRARRAEDLYRKEPAAIDAAADAARRAWWSTHSERAHPYSWDNLDNIERERWRTLVHAMLSHMVLG